MLLRPYLPNSFVAALLDVAGKATNRYRTGDGRIISERKMQRIAARERKAAEYRAQPSSLVYGLSGSVIQ